MRLLGSLLCLCWNVDGINFVQVITVSVSFWVKYPCPIQTKEKHFTTTVPHPLACVLFFFLTPSLVMLPESWGRRWCECPIVGWTLNSYLFSVIYPVISLCINHYPLQKKTSHVRLRAALIYGSKHKYLHIFRKLFGNMTILEKQQ